MYESHKTTDMSYAQPGSFLIHITGFVTRMTLDEQELFILPGHMGSPPVCIEVRCFSILFFLCIVLYIIICPFSSSGRHCIVSRYIAESWR